jgi:hypothetical protein
MICAWWVKLSHSNHQTEWKLLLSFSLYRLYCPQV